MKSQISAFCYACGSTFYKKIPKTKFEMSSFTHSKDRTKDSKFRKELHD